MMRSAAHRQDVGRPGTGGEGVNSSSKWRAIVGSATTFWTLMAFGAVAMFWQEIADSLHVGYPLALIKIAATIDVAIGGALVLSAIVLSTRHSTNGGSHG